MFCKNCGVQQKENVYDIKKEVYLEELKEANKCIVVSLETVEVAKGTD